MESSTSTAASPVSNTSIEMFFEMVSMATHQSHCRVNGYLHISNLSNAGRDCEYEVNVDINFLASEYAREYLNVKFEIINIEIVREITDTGLTLQDINSSCGSELLLQLVKDAMYPCIECFVSDDLIRKQEIRMSDECE